MGKDWNKTWWGISLMIIFFIVSIPYLVWTKVQMKEELKNSLHSFLVSFLDSYGLVLGNAMTRKNDGIFLRPVFFKFEGESMTKEEKRIYKESLYWKRKMLRIKFIYVKKAVLNEFKKFRRLLGEIWNKKGKSKE